MPRWVDPYKIRRSSNILSFIVHQNKSALEVFGESCFLLKRYERANAPFQKNNRRIPTITKVASSYTIDPDTGYLRYKLWGSSTDSIHEYPDIGVCTVTVQTTGTTNVWEIAVDKYSFIPYRLEYTFDIYQDEYDSNGTKIEDSVYVVFNTPPFHASNITTFTFGTANPLTKFESMQPVRDTQQDFYVSTFGFDQWLNPNTRIRRQKLPNRFLVAFPDKLTDFTLSDGGLIRDATAAYWTVPPPYSPLIMEHDVIVREHTGQRFQVTNMTPIYIENIYCSQNLTLAELDPRSTIYQIVLHTI
jgi:hypothetical protein